MTNELPITNEQFKTGILLVITLVILGSVYPLADSMFRSFSGGLYHDLKILLPLIFGAIMIMAVVSFITELNLIKFKKDDKLEFTPREIEKIKSKLEM